MPPSNLFRTIGWGFEFRLKPCPPTNPVTPTVSEASSVEFAYALSFGFFYIFNSRDRKM
jgi:hypothetical protein